MPTGLLLGVGTENSVMVPSGADFGEPHITVRPGGDPVRLTAGVGQGEEGDRAVGGDLADRVALVVGKPEVAVRPSGDVIGRRKGGCR
jgi:hypothetical protein